VHVYFPPQQSELEACSQEVKARQSQLKKAEAEYQSCEKLLRETKVICT